MKNNPLILISILMLFTCFIIQDMNALASVTDIVNHSEIDRALEKILMTRDDLTFNFYKDEKDPFRLKIVDDLFKKPINTYLYSDSITNQINKISRFTEDKQIFSQTIAYAYGLLDTPSEIKSADQYVNEGFIKKNKKQMKKLTNPEQDFITFVAGELYRINELNHQAYRMLSEEEQSLIRNFFVQEDSEEDVETDYLNLKLLREKTIESNEKIKKIYQLIAKIDFSKIAEASLIAAQMVENVHHQYVPEFSDDFKKKNREFSSEFGKIIINPGKECPLDDAVFVIDFSSDNVYHQVKGQNLLFLMDYYGHDVYRGRDFSQGGAFMSIQYFFDFEGNDEYVSNNQSQGSSCLGTGILFDFKGNDIYQSESLVQGCGKLGVGLLIDTDGNDQYFCSLYGQGFGYTKGLGSLIDDKGNDTYIVKKTHVDWLRYDSHFESLSQGCGLGIRPNYSGGIGLLSDVSGNDTYISDIYGQGTAYWYSLGALVDRAGNDQYISHQYAQGSGVHLAFASLIDYSGDDLYKSKGVSQGCGHDLAFGGLLDLRGDDNYVCYDLSQGGGNANAISFFVDYMGNDGYIARRENVMGYSDLRRSFGYIGLFLDMSGDDFYGSPIGGNNNDWVHSTYGVGRDLNLLSESEIAENQQASSAPVDIEIPDDIESLFLFGSAQAQSLAHLVQPARDRLIKKGVEAVPYLISQMNTELVREQLCLTETLPKMGREVYPYLKEALKDSTKTLFMISIIGLTKDSLAFELIRDSFNDPQQKYSAIKASGDLKNAEAVPYLIDALSDPSVAVRREAAIALQKIPDVRSISALIECLNDDYQEVRYSAQIALVKLKKDADKELRKALITASPIQKEFIQLIIK